MALAISPQNFIVILNPFSFFLFLTLCTWDNNILQDSHHLNKIYLTIIIFLYSNLHGASLGRYKIRSCCRKCHKKGLAFLYQVIPPNKDLDTMLCSNYCTRGEDVIAVQTYEICET